MTTTRRAGPWRPGAAAKALLLLLRHRNVEVSLVPHGERDALRLGRTGTLSPAELAALGPASHELKFILRQETTL